MALPRIRPASPEDLAGLPALEAAADRLLTAELGCQLPAAAEPYDPEEPLFLLVAGSPAVGFARVDNIGGQAHLEQLSVHPDFAGRGLGRSLVEAALVAATGSGIRLDDAVYFRGHSFQRTVLCELRVCNRP